MRPPHVLFAVLICVGCADGEPPRATPFGNRAQPKPRVERSSQPERELPAATDVDPYARSPEVERLLYRARQLRVEGRFEQSLALVEQALERDPDDPAAAALRQELLEILTRT